MSRRTEELTHWVYRGMWGMLTEWFRVPQDPPTLPGHPEELWSFRPAPGYLRYLKFQFWLGLLVVDIAILIGWIVLLVAAPILGVIAAPFAFALAVLPDIVAFAALHLRYDTTWYVMSSRSVRIRRGIWIIREMTFTFENVQNVKVAQGPLQRYFGIADVIVETAGGGGGQQQQGPAAMMLHHGRIEGVDNAHEIRDIIVQKLRRSKTAGLGDESQTASPRAGWLPEHIEALREIRDLCQALRPESSGGSSGLDRSLETQ